MKTFLFIAAIISQCLFANAADKIDAKALLGEIVGRAPADERQIVGVLRIRPAEGKGRAIPIKWMVLPGGSKWRDIYQTPESGSVPPEALIVTHQVGSTNTYEFHRAGKKVDDLGGNLFQPFASSDFWLVDLGLDFFHWPEPTHIDTEMRKSRACYVIESKNPSPQPGAYTRVVSWLDAENGGLIRAEAFDSRNKLLKTFEVRNIKKIKGRWHLKEIGIRNEQTDSSTNLEFDLSVEE